MPFFSKRPSKKPPRQFFATDLHSSKRTYRKFINAGKFYDVDLLVMGGRTLGQGSRENGFTRIPYLTGRCPNLKFWKGGVER